MLITFLIILQYVFYFLIVGILGYIAFIMISFKDLVPYVPTPSRIIKKMVQLAGIKDNERIIDLGSGTGRIILAAAKKHRQNLIVGLEKSPFLRLYTKWRLIFHPFLQKRIQIINGDFFNFNLSEYDVVFCFLTPEALRILAPKFQQLKSGSRIVSYMFYLDTYENFIEKTEHVTIKDSIYIYIKN